MANRTAQVTEKTFSSSEVGEFNKGIQIISFSPEAGLHFDVLDNRSLNLRIYADASYATNYDLSSQLGYIIMIYYDEHL